MVYCKDAPHHLCARTGLRGGRSCAELWDIASMCHKPAQPGDVSYSSNKSAWRRIGSSRTERFDNF
eukprot:scaffold18293_cov68-Phaeocystis_antarctica.AAC.3